MNGISTCTHAHPPMTTYDVNGSIAHRLKPSLSASCTMYSAKYNFMTFEKVCEYSDGQNKVDCTCRCGWGLSAGYQPRPQVVDRGTTARYGGQLRYI